MTKLWQSKSYFCRTESYFSRLLTLTLILLHTHFALCTKCSIHLAWLIKHLLPRLPAPLSTRQIALLFKDLVHYVFVASGKVFTNYFRLTAFLSSFMPTRISKVHVSWWLTQTRNFKDFLHTLYKSCFFRSWRETDQGNNFLWGQVISMFTPSSHWEMFISARCQTTCQTDVMNNFFRANIIQKEFNLLQMEQVNSQLSPSLSPTSRAFSRVSVLTHAVNLWQV